MANNEQINKVIEQLSQRLNSTPSEVESALKKGNLQQVLEKMDSKQAQKVQDILSDPKQSEKILSSPQAQALIKKLMG